MMKKRLRREKMTRLVQYVQSIAIEKQYCQLAETFKLSDCKGLQPIMLHSKPLQRLMDRLQQMFGQKRQSVVGKV